jgi:hypothetical protein
LFLQYFKREARNVEAPFGPDPERGNVHKSAMDL